MGNYIDFRKSRSSPVCADLQAEVLKCYQENKTQPLQCSSIVKKFNDAVQVQREVSLGCPPNITER